MVTPTFGDQNICKKKNPSWLFGVDRKICPSGSLFCITRHSLVMPNSDLGQIFLSTPHRKILIITSLLNFLDLLPRNCYSPLSVDVYIAMFGLKWCQFDIILARNDVRTDVIISKNDFKLSHFCCLVSSCLVLQDNISFPGQLHRNSHHGCKNIRIFNGCEVWIEHSATRLVSWCWKQ